MANRLKLFSNVRKKLFSSTSVVNEGGITLRKVKCVDCDYETETAANVSQLLCPQCGGKRFILVNPTRRSLFGNEEEDKDNEFQAKLKTYSGTKMSEKDFQKEFSDSANDLLEKGFAYKDGDSVKISDSAYATEKLFSKLIIQVTKILDLDKDIVDGSRSKADVLDSLEEREALPSKGILVIKKAHGILPPFESNFSETEEPAEDPGETWLKDSNIISDLQVEYYNQTLELKQFMKILEERYDDAPDNIIDLLLSHDAIRIEGNSVTINK